jgi:prepilin-type N-terminal cleavage/methylation domain-containing protein
MQTKGFTLIELIITISILAVLVAILVVALNPAEQLARARDTKRVADLDALRTALNLYLAQATGTPNLSGDTTANNRCIGGAGTVSFFMNTASATGTIPSGFTAIVTSTGQSVATSTASASFHWLPALVGATPGGSPLANLPLDPTNGTGVSTSSFYGYGCRSSNKTFEITARLESSYFQTDLDLDGTDGGNSSSTFEVGTDLSIVPNAS